MAQNIIYYGPPGTGKTYFVQKRIEEYVDYNINDGDIESIYSIRSEEWLLIALIIMQHNDPMTTIEICDKISSLSLGYNENVSYVLERHSIQESSMGLERVAPRIFFEINSKWYVDRIKILEYDKDFINNYATNINIDKRYDFVTFHQSFVYEDFVEGIRPIKNRTTGGLGYEIESGIFKKMCEKARSMPHKQYALFIDEINRGNISEIFGELISLIELDKRIGEPCELEVVLPYSKELFGVPNNLNIIGTMNSADKSISPIDDALRRRFDFINISCDYDILEQIITQNGQNPRDINGIDVIKLLTIINKRIELLMDNNHIIGHAFFIKVKSFNDIKNIIIRKIIPLLEEYFYDDLQKIQIILNDLDENGDMVDNAIYCHKELVVDSLIRFTGDYPIDNKRQYYLNKKCSVESIVKIYEGFL